MSRGKTSLRRFLWERDPICFWCGIVTIWVVKEGGGYPPDCCTIDHVFSRYDLRLRKKWGNPVVLACNKCNARRGAEETQKQTREELWQRANRRSKKLQTYSGLEASSFSGKEMFGDLLMRGKKLWPGVTATVRMAYSSLRFSSLPRSWIKPMENNMDNRQYKVTIQEYVESLDSSPGFFKSKSYLLTAKEVEEFSGLNPQFAIETQEYKEA